MLTTPISSVRTEPNDPWTGCPNPGIVPPDLQWPILILPMPDGWEEPELKILPISDLAPSLRSGVVTTNQKEKA